MQGGTPNHITLDHLDLGYCDIVGSNPDGRGVRMRGADSITITNTTIHDIGGVGIAGLAATTNVLIDRVTIHHIDDGRGVAGDGDGINMDYADNAWPSNITIRNSKVWDTSEDGVDIKGDNVLEENVIVSGAASVDFKVWSVWAAGYAQQGHFTLINCTGYHGGDCMFKAFSLPVVMIQGCTFVGTGADSEPAVLFRRPYGAEPWQGSLTIHNTIMEHVEGHAALDVARYCISTMDLEGNTYCGTGRYASIMRSSASGFQGFSNAQMTDGTFTAATGTEHSPSSAAVDLPPLILSAGSSGAPGPGQDATFTGVAVDAANLPLTYTWHLGDGALADGPCVTHSYAGHGSYQAGLHVENGVKAAGCGFWVAVGTLQGDFNGDGSTDGLDFLVWQVGLGKTIGAKKSDGDANGDGRVDGIDFLFWQTELHA
jgi:hypothetical protein